MAENQSNQSTLSIFLIKRYIHILYMFIGQFGHEKHIPGVIFPIRSTPDRLWPKIGQINRHYRFFYLRGMYTYDVSCMFIGQFGQEKLIPGVIFAIRSTPNRSWLKIDREKK